MIILLLSQIGQWYSIKYIRGSLICICIGTKLYIWLVHNYIMKSNPTHNGACPSWVGCLFSWNSHSWCNVHCETPVCCLDPPQSIGTVAVGTLWSPGALVLHTAPATQQASICDAGTAVSEVGALLHWETVDLREGERWRKRRWERTVRKGPLTM